MYLCIYIAARLYCHPVLGVFAAWRKHRLSKALPYMPFLHDGPSCEELRFAGWFADDLVTTFMLPTSSS